MGECSAWSVADHVVICCRAMAIAHTQPWVDGPQVLAVLTSLGITVSVTGRRPEEAARRAAEFGIGVHSGGESDLFVAAAPVSPPPPPPSFLDL